MNEVEEIKNRLNIADVISEYIQLTQAGVNYKARCPFHDEKTPSFFVAPDKQIWHCFGSCDEGGDIFTFVQKMEGIEFREALKILADRAGVKLTPRNPQAESKKNRLLEVCDWAARFFHQALLRSKEAQIARDYLASRKVEKKSIEEFILGYSPNSWDLLSRFLRKRGYHDLEIAQAGLSVQKNQGKFYDRFRGRLIFPINNIHGQTLGFGARVLDEQRDPLGKYINSPQSLIYDKSGVLYGLDRAKNEIKKRGFCIAVEGYLDVITSHAISIRNVISVSGTALTLRQIGLIKRYGKNLALSFDADSAGFQAAKKGIDNAIATGMNVKVIVLPPGEDPDSLIKKGPKLWRAAIKRAQSVMDFYFNRAFGDHNSKELEGKKLIAAELLPVIKKIPDDIEQAHYLQELSSKIEMKEEILRKAMDKVSFDQRPKTQETEESPQGVDSGLSLEEVLGRRILGLGLRYPRFLGQILKGVKTTILPSYLQEIYRILKKYYNKDEAFVFSDFKRKIESSHPSLASKIDVAVLGVEKDFEQETEESVISEELEANLKRLQKEYLQKELKELEIEIKKAEDEGNRATLKELTERFSSLTQGLAGL